VNHNEQKYNVFQNQIGLYFLRKVLLESCLKFLKLKYSKHKYRTFKFLCSKQVNKASDITFGSVTLPKSLESATAEAAQGKLNSEVLLERNGSTPAFEDSSKSS
jgi:hypothetical protein